MLQFISNLHEKIKGWRTVIFASLSTVPYIFIEIYDGLKDAGIDTSQVLTTLGWEKWIPVYGLIIALLTIWFRAITKGKLGDKDAHKDQ